MSIVFQNLRLLAELICLPLGIFVFVAVLPVWIAAKAKSKSGAAADLIAFALLGAVLGVFTGASRSPAVSALLPVLATLVTGLLAYLANTNAQGHLAQRTPYCIVAMLLATMLSGFYGAMLRSTAEIEEARQKKALLFYEKVQLEYEKAKLLQTLSPATPLTPKKR